MPRHKQKISSLLLLLKKPYPKVINNLPNKPSYTTGLDIILILIVLLSLLQFPHSASAVQPKPPEKPSNYVTDLASILPSKDAESINSLFYELEQKTGAQILILTINSLEGDSIESFSLSMAEKWKPGVKGKDNGILITVSLLDKKYRIEVGYGLEGILPDSLAGTLGRQLLVPRFREGKYAEGLLDISSKIAGLVADHYGIALTYSQGFQSAPSKGTDTPQELELTDLLIIVVIILVVIYLLFRHPELLLLMLSRASSSGGGWSGGGGFGGGRGGSFGGGGASGGW